MKHYIIADHFGKIYFDTFAEKWSYDVPHETLPIEELSKIMNNFNEENMIGMENIRIINE